MLGTKTIKGSEQELSLKNEILGIAFLFVSIFTLFSLVSHSPYDPSFFHATVNQTVVNFGGRVGAEIAALFFNLFGYASYVIFASLLFFSSYFFFNRQIKNMTSKSIGYLLLLISGSLFLAIVAPVSSMRGVEIKSGGIIGYFIAEIFRGSIKPFFSFILSVFLIIISLILIAKLSLYRIVGRTMTFFARLVSALRRRIKQRIEEHRRNKQKERVEIKYRGEPAVATGKARESQKGRNGKKAVRIPSKGPEESLLFSDLEEDGQGTPRYQPPPLTYLDAPTQRSQIDYRELDEKKEELAGRLEEFRIKGEIQEYTPGPVITTYEFVPDTGVKVKDVTNLSEDLALVVKAQYVRIERILGKKAIGIEIPNKKRETIHLREILESEEYRHSSSPLTIALGKSKSGEIFITDLREMPHLIIAGATGSGKSVAIHTIILSILYKSSPDMVKFVLIDPKRVELAIYNSLPHLLTPVVVNTKLAKNALDWTVFEIEERYKKLALLQVRNIEQFNKKIDLIDQADEELMEKLNGQGKMAYIVVIIDEFADLMMESQREIEDNIQKIAQKARAVGIHLILATQRPSTDVITGTIKNNFPSRIALAVPSKFDSRTIIDVMGAEKLLGQGDMLFLPPKTATLVRLHCAFVSEEEALRVVRYLSKQEKPKFDTSVIRPQSKGGEDAAEDSMDPLFFDAAEVVITSGQASASHLQRRMRVGYARAGRLMDQLQARGVVSAANSRNQRDILVDMEELEKMKP